MPLLEFVDLWQQRLSALQAVGCDYSDATLGFKLLGTVRQASFRVL
jgi:hypothetical protein